MKCIKRFETRQLMTLWLGEIPRTLVCLGGYNHSESNLGGIRINQRALRSIKVSGQIHNEGWRSYIRGSISKEIGQLNMSQNICITWYFEQEHWKVKTQSHYSIVQFILSEFRVISSLFTLKTCFWQCFVMILPQLES